MATPGPPAMASAGRPVRAPDRRSGRAAAQAGVGTAVSTLPIAFGPVRSRRLGWTRPPAEPWTRAPAREVVDRAVELFRSYEIPTSYLTEDVDTGSASFAAVADDPAQGLLGIVAVHPMTEAAARDYLTRSGADWSVARSLIDSGLVVAVQHGGRTYLRRAFKHGIHPETGRKEYG